MNAPFVLACTSLISNDHNQLFPDAKMFRCLALVRTFNRLYHFGLDFGLVLFLFVCYTHHVVLERFLRILFR